MGVDQFPKGGVKGRSPKAQGGGSYPLSLPPLDMYARYSIIDHIRSVPLQFYCLSLYISGT